MANPTRSYWLIKTEPGTWSWQDQCNANDQQTEWDGVKNHLANRHLREMKVGDICLFYHSVSEKAIVGTVEVVRTWQPNPDDQGPFGSPRIGKPTPLATPLSLEKIKSVPELHSMVLVRNSRLSVQPVTTREWALLQKLIKKG